MVSSLVTQYHRLQSTGACTFKVEVSPMFATTSSRLENELYSPLYDVPPRITVCAISVKVENQTHALKRSDSLLIWFAHS